MERAGEGHAAEHPRRSDKRLLGYKAEREIAPFLKKGTEALTGETTETTRLRLANGIQTTTEKRATCETALALLPPASGLF